MHLAIAAAARSVRHAGWQICLIATAVVLVWASIALHLVHQHDELESEAVRDNGNLVYAAEQSIEGMIANIDQTLRFIRAAYVADPSGFNVNRWISTTHLERENLAIEVIDRDGIRRPGAHIPTVAPVDGSDRLNFATPLNPQADVLRISEPRLLRSSGKWSVQFSRRIMAADGSFVGIAVLSLDPSWLTRLYETLDIGQGALMVVGIDGVVRARASSSGLGMGQNIRSSDLIENALAAARGNFRSVSPLDNVDRFVSFRRLPDYPLIVSIGRNAGDVFMPYRHDLVKYLTVGGALTILILIIGALLMKQNRRLLHSRQVLSDAVEHISQGLIMIDEERQMPLVNGRAAELLDIPSELLARKVSWDELIRWQMETDEFRRGTEEEKRFHALNVRHPALHDACYERMRPDGRVLEIRTQMLPSGGAVRTYSDITELKRSEAQIRHMAHHDALTGLANRTLLNDRLSHALKQSARDGGAVAVLALDLDRFKAVNDGFGHAAGDRLLVQVSNRLQDVLRASDTLARVGGDEFVVVQAGAGQPTGATELAHRLIEALSEPFDLGDTQLSIRTSVGIALYPANGDSSSALLTNADAALYRAKAIGRGTLCFFEHQMDMQARERHALERDLRSAIGTEQLRLDFQPIFAAATRRLVGFEALLRWQHPVRGNIPPMIFIPIAEETGMILPIAAWVLEQACRSAAAWPVARRLSVNLSAAQLRSGYLPTQVAEILRRTGLSAQLLELEVTESLLINDPGRALATLQELRDMGVGIACDDFGTGYSSFSYLQNLVFDRIKIDRPFVQALGFTSSALQIVQAILAMARSLGMDVIAEGVETEQQLTMLCEQGCGEVQGFLLGRPIPGDQVLPCLQDATVDANTVAA